MALSDRTAHDIIIKPVITERAMDNLQQRKYTFRVMKNANKIEIAKAVEALFGGVRVDKVNTMTVRGRKRRQGRNEGYTPSWKKAIVTLKKDSKTIEFFDGMV
ncbi:MAG: 50S ribosomal protein L23 [Oscillospiraceae bacterium]|jgi:large subunit ribosomal protein L23|nr:50S ribosomal protein L23 [Oscillospiraceae bacterium]